MTDLLDSDNIGMHFWINGIIYLRTNIWAEFELLSFYTHLISALVFQRPQSYVGFAKSNTAVQCVFCTYGLRGIFIQINLDLTLIW